jgi:hypothetical protein
MDIILDNTVASAITALLLLLHLPNHPWKEEER